MWQFLLGPDCELKARMVQPSLARVRQVWLIAAPVTSAKRNEGFVLDLLGLRGKIILNLSHRLPQRFFVWSVACQQLVLTLEINIAEHRA